VSYELPIVSNRNCPDDGAVQVNHTVAPLYDAPFGGVSPGSSVAPDVDPLQEPLDPLSATGDANASFAGGEPGVRHVSVNVPIGAAPSSSTAIEYVVPFTASKPTKLALSPQ